MNTLGAGRLPRQKRESVSVLARLPHFDPIGLRSGELFDLADLNRRTRSANEAAIRGRCANAYLGDHRSLCRVLGRYKMFVDTRDVDVAAHLLLDGYWEFWVTAALSRLIRPGMTCVDVGAHLGYFTLLMADMVGSTGRVHAFEPNPDMRALLGQSIRLNGFEPIVEINGTPLLDEDDVRLELVVPPGQSGGAYVRPATGDMPVLLSGRLDAVAGLQSADLIKIDAEASEEKIWRGMRGLLDQRRPLIVVIEFTLARYAEPEAFIATMLGDGFSLSRIDPDCGVRKTDASEVLRAPAAADQMLVLRR